VMGAVDPSASITMPEIGISPADISSTVDSAVRADYLAANPEVAAQLKTQADLAGMAGQIEVAPTAFPNEPTFYTGQTTAAAPTGSTLNIDGVDINVPEYTSGINTTQIVDIGKVPAGGIATVTPEAVVTANQATAAQNLQAGFKSGYNIDISPETAQTLAVKGITDPAAYFKQMTSAGYSPEAITQILEQGGTPTFLQNVVARPASYALKGLGYTMLAKGLFGGEEEEPSGGSSFQMEDTRAGIPFANLFYNPTTGQYQDTAPDYLSQQSSRLRRAAAGGHISGPGTGTSDSIPARLSDGEFVMTAQAVRGMGKGSRAEGAAKMYELMNRLERMA